MTYSTEKWKYFKLCLEVIFIFILVVGGLKILEINIDLPVFDSDEVSWIFTGYYFNLYFLQLNFFHPDWNDYEAFDQPPVGKYIVGGALYARGYPIDSLDQKRFINSMPLAFIREYFDLITPKVPNPKVVIPFLRSIIFFFALTSLLLLYISVRISYGLPASMISTIFIVSNPIFGAVSTRILGDPIILLFFALFTLLCSLYLNFRHNIYILFAFIVSSAAFSTKLNGIVLVPLLIIFFLNSNKPSLSGQNIKVLTTGLLIFLIFSIMINPVFLNTGPDAIGKMIDARLSAFKNFQDTFNHLALRSINERFISVTQIIFFDNSLFYRFTKIPFELIIFLIGIFYIFRMRNIFLISIFIFLIILPVSMFPFRLSRYCYLIFPFIYIISSQSLNVYKIFSKRSALKYAHKME